MKTFTRSGIRRSGDDYQDLFALDLLVEMLEHPTRYEWIRVEADDAGALDDVVALRTDGRFVARQVKFAGHPEDEADAWTWDRLLQRSKNERAGPSLLARWFSSWRDLRARGDIAEAALLSNRGAGTDVRAVLGPDGKISFDEIAEDVRNEIGRQLGSDDEAKDFFGEFRFFVDRPDMATLEDALRRRFFNLGGNEFGWLALKDELRLWVRERLQPPPDGSITLRHVRAAARWHRLEPLREDFVVPDDYTLPSAEFDAQLFEDITSLRRGCRVLAGRPGLGKSTYLSQMVTRLKKAGIPVIRHHYFLMVGERVRGRLEHQRVAESLMSEIEANCLEALGSIGSGNPRPDQLGAWLETCGAHFAAEGKSLIVIVDGLDHVWREQASREELDRLFEHLLPAPEGLVVVVGTQPVDEEQLPRRLVHEVPREAWSDLPLLDRAAVESWLWRHERDLSLPEESHSRAYVLRRLADAFEAKTGGHPLHLRFTLKALLERGLVPSAETVLALPGGPHEDITRYYADLWQSLPEHGRAILHLLAATGFPWPPSGIVAALDPTHRDTVAVNQSLREVRHLLLDDPLGVRPFHSSLLVFVKAQPAHALHAPVMRDKALQWLKDDAPDYWRWAYNWVLEAEIGRAGPLIDGPSRTWVTDAIARRYPREQLIEILARSAWAALEAGRLARFVHVGLLLDYADAIRNTSPDLGAALLPAQLTLDEDLGLRSRLQARPDTLDPEEVAALARGEASRGNTAGIRGCLDALNRLRPCRATNDEWTRWATTVSTVAALLPTIDVERLAQFAGQFQDPDIAGQVIDAYARSLRIERRVGALRELLRAQAAAVAAWPESGRMATLRHAVLLALEEGVDLASPEALVPGDPFAVVYFRLRGDTTVGHALQYPSTDLPRSEPGDLSTMARPAANMLYRAFFALLASHLRGEASFAHAWLDGVNDPYLRDLLERLEALATTIAREARAGRSVAFAEPYRCLQGAPRPHWTDDRQAGEVADGMEFAARDIAFDLAAMQAAWGGGSSIEQQDLEILFSSRFCRRWAWIAAYIEHDRCLLAEEALSWLLREGECDVDAAVEPFGERASRYASLAALSAMHGRVVEDVDRLVRKAASNALTYGNHKDLLLDSMLEIARVCHEAGSRRVEQWLLSIAPAIAHVEDFTDGDETGHLPRELGEILAIVKPQRLPAYYLWLREREEYYDARSVFHALLKVADLTEPVAAAVAMTAIDDRSIDILRERAGRHDSGAIAVLQDIVALLGERRPRIAERSDTDTDHGIARESEDASGPDPTQYPPPLLKDYLSATRAAYTVMDRGVGSWISYWTSQGNGLVAFDAVAALARSGYEVRGTDLLFELAMRYYGREEAYPWLVNAQREERGWSRFYTRKEHAVRRWEAIKRWYPDQSLQFVRDTLPQDRGDPWEGISAHDKVLRLVEYCNFIDEPMLAEQIGEQVVSSILELVSPVELAVPGWLVVT